MDFSARSAPRSEPPGISFLKRYFHCMNNTNNNIKVYQTQVLIITFIAYASFHASRKPISIVKAVLKGNWAPFDGDQAAARLGELDVSFLLVYSFGMYFAGHLGDRLDLRIFLCAGMIASGFFVGLFGMGYWLRIHSFVFYLGVQMIQGLFQATGWPSVVAVVGNWFGKSRRGLILGVWNAHTSVGNIAGSLISAAMLDYGWGLSFLLPGILVAVAGVVVFLFLVVAPEDAGFETINHENDDKVQFAETENGEDLGKMALAPSPVIELSKLGSGNDDASNEKNIDGFVDLKLKDEEESLNVKDQGRFQFSEVDIHSPEQSNGVDNEEESLLHAEKGMSTEEVNNAAIGFVQAWMIPGVAPYAFCLFFSKLVAYTFLYWLPFYIRHTAISGKQLSHSRAGNLSTLFDLGGVAGGILAGLISDKLDARAITSVAFLYLAIPVLILFRVFGSVSMPINIALMMAAGLLVNGPYSLITTAVSADLGTHSSIKGNSRALATVTAIIDGTGSVGAALGPLLTGYISQKSWTGVFFMLIVSVFFAGLFLIRLAKAEYRENFCRGETLPPNTIQNPEP